MFRRTTICALILLAVCAFFAVGRADAQRVWVSTEAYPNEVTRTLHGIHRTEVDYAAWLYYQPYVEGFIVDEFGTRRDFDSDLDSNGFVAEVHTHTTYQPGQTFAVYSDHYVAGMVYEPGPGATGSYWNPYGFGPSGPGNQPFWGFGPGTVGGWSVPQLIYLGRTLVIIRFYGVPHIDEIIPTGGPLDTSIEVSFSGTNFRNNPTVPPTVSVSGTGVTADSIQFSTDTRLSLIFHIASNAAPGDRSVTISAHTYTSNAVNFRVGDRTPQITSINPSRGSAGEVVPVTISGSGFGSAPIVNVGGGIIVSVTTKNDQQITANFSIPSTALPGNHQVTVTSNGVNGSGFVAPPGGSATSNAVDFTVDALAAPRIISYSPESAQLGVSIEINVIGENFGSTRTLQISGQGVTVQSYSTVSDPDHQIVAILNIADDAETGNHSISVSAGGQTSNSVTFLVGSRSLQVTSIDPPSGVRGTTFPVVVTGSGFGSNPTLQVSGTEVTVTINQPTTDTRINATFQISSIALPVTRIVTVTSRGTSGNGFVQTPGANPSATVPFDIKNAGVKINSADSRFAPSVERLDIIYSITPVGNPAPFARLEIYKKGDSTNPVFRDETIPKAGSNIQYSQGGIQGWDGIGNMGADNGKFIGPENSPYTVRVTIATDGTFTTTKMDHKKFKVEIFSIETTPPVNSAFSIIKPSPTPTPVPAQTPEISTELTVVVKLKNKAKKAEGVTTAIPFKLHWRFEDPDDTSDKALIDTNLGQENDNAPLGRFGKSGSQSIMWKQVTGSTTTVDTGGQTAVTDTIVSAGPDLGSAKIAFLSSSVAGDNYLLRLEVKTEAGLRVGKEIKFKKWSVRKRLDFGNVFRMLDGADVGKSASYDNVHEAFDGDGYTDYIAATTVTPLVAGPLSPEFAASLESPNPAETPTAQELTDHLAGVATATVAISNKARAWYNRNTVSIDTKLRSIISAIPAPRLSLIGGRFYHPKHDGRPGDGRPAGSPDFYPTGIIFLDNNNIPRDPNGEWSEVQGAEIDEVSFIFLSAVGERAIIVSRHEVGHASDHVPFHIIVSVPGDNDHAPTGLMHKTADITLRNPFGVNKFSDDSILRLRGWKR